MTPAQRELAERYTGMAIVLAKRKSDRFCPWLADEVVSESLLTVCQTAIEHRGGDFLAELKTKINTDISRIRRSFHLPREDDYDQRWLESRPEHDPIESNATAIKRVKTEVFALEEPQRSIIAHTFHLLPSKSRPAMSRQMANRSRDIKSLDRERWDQTMSKGMEVLRRRMKCYA